MREPILAQPLDQEEKTRVFMQVGSKTTDREMLNNYVETFIQKNGLQNYEIADTSKRKLLASAVLAVAAAIEIVLFALYHSRPFVYIIIIEILVYAPFFRAQSLKNYLVKEIIRRPDDNLDNILISQVSGAKSGLLNLLFITCPLVIVAVASALIFMRPHMIFEENNMGGYSLRFYTASVISDENIVIPETYKGKPVNEIRGNVFQDMRNLHYVTLPPEITQIRASTFERCTGLREIDIPKGVTRIAAHAFCDCSSLSKVTVPSTVNEIGSSAFRRCDSLREISIPRGATVNAKAFKESPTQVDYY